MPWFKWYDNEKLGVGKEVDFEMGLALGWEGSVTNGATPSIYIFTKLFAEQPHLRWVCKLQHI